MSTVADIVAFLEDFAPIRRAAEWDNVGLILGARAGSVSRILTCLTVTPEVVAKAVSANVSLIVTHHPMLFRAVQKITDSNPEGQMVLALLRAGIAVYSPHTSFDNCAGGINDLLAQKLELQNVTSLRPFESDRQFKIVVFVPETDLAKVSDAMFVAGAGTIGQYTQCSFRIVGTGTFFGSDSTNPTIGEKGRREEINEWRLEAVCAEAHVDAVVAAIRSVHSYEEPAYDVYELRASRAPIGEGRVGELSKSIALRDYAKHVRSTLACGPVQIVGDPDRLVRKIAVACGAASEYLRDAVKARADLFLTGEARFHDYLSAQAQGIAMLLPGHYATERIGIEALAERLARAFPRIAVSPSEAERDPVFWI